MDNMAIKNGEKKLIRKKTDHRLRDHLSKQVADAGQHGYNNTEKKSPTGNPITSQMYAQYK